MKVVACIFAILSGLFGLFGGTAQTIFGGAIGMMTKNDETMNNGMLVFCLSWVLIILGGLSLRFPKQSGIALIIVSIISFSLGNIFSAPFAFIAGIFDLFDGSERKKSGTGVMTQSPIEGKEPIYDNKFINSGEEGFDNTYLLNQLSKLHDLKEKKVITEEIYEQERLHILSKFKVESKPHTEVINETIAEANSSIEAPVVVQEEVYDPEFTAMFEKTKWHKKPALWIIAVGFIFLLLWIFNPLHKNALPAPYSNTSHTGASIALVPINYSNLCIFKCCLSSYQQSQMTKKQFTKLIFQRDIFLLVGSFVCAWFSISLLVDLNTKITDLIPHTGKVILIDSVITKVIDKPLFKQITRELRLKINTEPQYFTSITTVSFNDVTSKIKMGDTVTIFTKPKLLNFFGLKKSNDCLLYTSDAADE